MGVFSVIIFVISIAIAVKIVNWAYEMYMKMIGATYMTFNVKTKAFAIFMVMMVVMGIIMKILSIFGVVFE